MNYYDAYLDQNGEDYKNQTLKEILEKFRIQEENRRTSVPAHSVAPEEQKAGHSRARQK